MIWAGIWRSLDDTMENMKRAMKCYGYASAMFSRIFMTKENCITKEQFDIEYGITNDEEANITATEERDDLSVGEDLETLIRRIKNREITKEKNPYGDTKQSHLLCLLDKEKRRLLDRKDESFLNTFFARAKGHRADVDEEEWKKSEYKHLKFSRSVARRQTTFVEAEDEFEDESSDASLPDSLEDLQIFESDFKI